jgi:arginase
VRSYEPEEAALLACLGVRVLDMAEVSARGMRAVMGEAVERAGGAGAGYGISIDLDAVDPVDAPGVGSAVPGGIRRGALLDSLERCAADERLLAVEIAEYNPHRDAGLCTAALVEDLLHILLGNGLARPAHR